MIRLINIAGSKKGGFFAALKEYLAKNGFNVYEGSDSGSSNAMVIILVADDRVVVFTTHPFQEHGRAQGLDPAVVAQELAEIVRPLYETSNAI